MKHLNSVSIKPAAAHSSWFYRSCSSVFSKVANGRFAPEADVPYLDWWSTLRVSRRRRVAFPGRLTVHPRFRKPPAPQVRILATLCGGTHYALHNGEFADRYEMKAPHSVAYHDSRTGRCSSRSSVSKAT